MGSNYEAIAVCLSVVLAVLLIQEGAVLGFFLPICTAELLKTQNELDQQHEDNHLPRVARTHKNLRHAYALPCL